MKISMRVRPAYAGSAGFGALYHGSRSFHAVKQAIELLFMDEDRYVHVRGCSRHAPHSKGQSTSDGIRQTVFVETIREP